MKRKPYLTEEEKNFIKAYAELTNARPSRIIVDSRGYIQLGNGTWFWLAGHFKGLKKNKIYKYEELVKDEND